MAHATRKRVWQISILVLLSATCSICIALGAAALRPSDGFPNVLGTSAMDYSERYFQPQHRKQTAAGEVFVDILGGSLHTCVTLSPVWARRLTPEDAWLFKTYPLIEDIPAQAIAVTGPVAKLPYWASECDASSSEHNLITHAWGWPFRCLSGTEHVFASHGTDGKFLGTRSTFDGYLIRGSGPAGTRFRRIPLDVIWLGLAMNSALGAAVFGGVVLLGGRLFALRRGMRRRRGLCSTCGYPAGASAVCSECGGPVTPTARSAA